MYIIIKCADRSVSVCMCVIEGITISYTRNEKLLASCVIYILSHMIIIPYFLSIAYGINNNQGTIYYGYQDMRTVKEIGHNTL